MAKPTGHGWRQPRGITLLEVMTVCAVIGILTALAVDSWQGSINRARSDDAVTGVYGQLLVARKLARTHNQPVRLAVLTDGGVTTARWERLPCDNETFGMGCPSAGCTTTEACGAGSCPCRDTGNWMAIPSTVDMTPWGGLCFLGGTGQAIPRIAGTGDCLGPSPNGPVSLKVSAAHTLDRWLVLEPVSGQPRLMNCDPNADAGCT
jgi:prepilin-type N-terminal cleavage/methylation domain-containing protein